MELIDRYLSEIILATGTSILLGVWGIIWSFFKGIKSLKAKVMELESELKANAKSDEQMKKWIDEIILNKLKK